MCFTSYVVVDRILYLVQLIGEAAFTAPLINYWAYDLLEGLSVLFVVLTIAVVFVNVRRLRVAYLLLGSVLLVALPIYTAAAG